MFMRPDMLRLSFQAKNYKICLETKYVGKMMRNVTSSGVARGCNCGIVSVDVVVSSVVDVRTC